MRPTWSCSTCDFTAIRNSSLGECAMLCDAECHARYLAFPDALLSRPLKTSRPDILLLEHVRTKVSSLTLDWRRDPRTALHLIEVTYTTDLHMCAAGHSRAAGCMCGYMSLSLDHLESCAGTMLRRSCSSASPCRVIPFLSDLTVHIRALRHFVLLSKVVLCLRQHTCFTLLHREQARLNLPICARAMREAPYHRPC